MQEVPPAREGLDPVELRLHQVVYRSHVGLEAMSSRGSRPMDLVGDGLDGLGQRGVSLGLQESTNLLLLSNCQVVAAIELLQRRRWSMIRWANRSA